MFWITTYLNELKFLCNINIYIYTLGPPSTHAPTKLCKCNLSGCLPNSLYRQPEGLRLSDLGWQPGGLRLRDLGRQPEWLRLLHLQLRLLPIHNYIKIKKNIYINRYIYIIYYISYFYLINSMNI